jgi:hypothetical protein
LLGQRAGKKHTPIGKHNGFAVRVAHGRGIVKSTTDEYALSGRVAARKQGREAGEGRQAARRDSRRGGSKASTMDLHGYIEGKKRSDKADRQIAK